MASKNPEKPNIIFILSDDQGYWALASSGNKEIKTPVLDKLAAEGMRFENFFCTSPVCSPARASIFTGKIPSQHGVHDYVSTRYDNIEYLQGQTAYTDVLAENGYRCGISGKWHLGHSVKPQLSFDHWYVHQKGGANYYNAPMVKGGEKINEPGYITDNITDNAIKFIDSQEDNKDPFYLSVHYTAPHRPWLNNHPQEYLDLYKDCKFESVPDESMHPWQIEGHPHPEDTGIDRKEYLRGYFAATTAMDANIGRILTRIEEQGLRENTIIIFTSDNGMNMGHHGIYGKGNGTYPQNMYDTSVKVPMIISRPTYIPAGQVCQELFSHYDFMPTILDYLGISYNGIENLPGNSFAPILKGVEVEGRDNIVVFDEYGPVRMIRSKDWKYIHRYPRGPHELYDLNKDPDEENNLYQEMSRQYIVEEMKSRLDKWFMQYVDPNINGVLEPVCGMGQFNFAGIYNKGAKAYGQNVVFLKNTDENEN